MYNYSQQQGNSFASGNHGVPDHFQFFFAGGVPAPSSGIYALTPAPPGGLSSLGPRVVFEQ